LIFCCRESFRGSKKGKMFFFGLKRVWRGSSSSRHQEKEGKERKKES